MRALLLALTLLSLPAAASAQQALRPGDPVERTLAAADAHAYRLDLPAGQFVLGSADQQTVDVVVTITGPGGETIQTVDEPARGPEAFQFTTGAAGTYTLTVTPFDGAEGRYTMRLDRVEPVATTPEGTVDQLFAVLDHDDSPGAVVGVLEHGQITFARAYGMADLTHGVPFTLDTPSNIASTSKQFTAFAVAWLADQGRLSLDDDVRTYIPELPDFGQTVTLRHLLTHTSGYRDYLTALAMSGLVYPEDHIDRDDVLGVVERQPELQNAPGAEFNYNNTGYGLLALIVERVTETPFQDWMRETVFEPLGMTHTVVRHDPDEIVPGRAMGYVPAAGGRWQEARDLGGAMGDGFLYTTAGDLLRWMDTYRTASLGGEAVLREMTTEAVLTTGGSTGYGLGLFLGERRGLRQISHSGSDVGYRADFVYYPEIESGVVVLTNSPTVPARAGRVADVFFADAFAPKDVPEANAPEANAPEAEVAETEPAVPDYDPASFDPVTFDAYAGRYEVDGFGVVQTYARRGDRFYVQELGGPEHELVPVGLATFELQGVDARVEFVAGDDGVVSRLVYTQGRPYPAVRLTDDRDVNPEDYAGLYVSEELGAVYTVRVVDGDLVLVHTRLDDPVPLRHVTGERFRGGYPIADLEFERGTDGSVAGFLASYGRSKGVRFRRMPEASARPSATDPR